MIAIDHLDVSEFQAKVKELSGHNERRKTLMEKKLETADAAIKLIYFVKFNEFPMAGTQKFFELTDLINGIETALYRDGIVKPEVWKEKLA